MFIIKLLESGGRVQLPAQWLEELGVRKAVTLEQTPQGILVRPAPEVTWEEIFKDKLPIGQSPIETEIEVTTDDLLF